MTIQVSSTDRRDGKALALFARSADWQQGRTKDGRSFFAIPGSDANLFHMTDVRECSCADFQRARNVCKHIRAVRLWMAAYRTGAVAPKPRPDSTDLDDRAVLTVEGAAYLANLNDPVDPHVNCAVVDGDREMLTRLQAQQADRVTRLLQLGYDRDEFSSDGEYVQRAEWIASLTTCQAIV